MAIPLQYQGSETLDESAAFNARKKTGTEGTIAAGGNFLYRVFPSPERIFFIKLDSGTDPGLAFFFGAALAGPIQQVFQKNKIKSQTQAKLANYAGMRPALLLSQDKNNFVMRRAEISQPTIHPPSVWHGGKFGRWTFRDAKKKKRTFIFEDVANFCGAVERLRAAFGDELIVRARFDDERKKIVKVKPNA